MIRVGLLGYSGRMGQAIAQEIATSKACVLAAGLVREAGPKVEGVLIMTEPDKVFSASDVVIDFTSADAAPMYAQLAAAHGKPYMCGATGLSDTGMNALKAAAKTIPLLYAANTSLSLAVMKQVTALAAQLLADFNYEIAIHDEHHAQKKDAPSGTAKALGAAIVKANSGKKIPAYSAVREGAIIGNHEVTFTGPDEVIRLYHSVTDRAVFARGALQAALWLHNKPAGLYGMEDVLQQV